MYTQAATEEHASCTAQIDCSAIFVTLNHAFFCYSGQCERIIIT